MDFLRTRKPMPYADLLSSCNSRAMQVKITDDSTLHNCSYGAYQYHKQRREDGLEPEKLTRIPAYLDIRPDLDAYVEARILNTYGLGAPDAQERAYRKLFMTIKDFKNEEYLHKEGVTLNVNQVLNGINSAVDTLLREHLDPVEPAEAAKNRKHRKPLIDHAMNAEFIYGQSVQQLVDSMTASAAKLPIIVKEVPGEPTPATKGEVLERLKDVRQCVARRIDAQMLTQYNVDPIVAMSEIDTKMREDLAYAYDALKGKRDEALPELGNTTLAAACRSWQPFEKATGVSIRTTR